MSGSLNKVMLIGNLGKDPEVKMTPSGQSLARFSLATTETWTSPDKGKQSKTEWHNVVVWGKQAEIAEKFLRKGKQILVEGRIMYREYTDQSGAKRTACDIRCDHFVMLGRMDEGGGPRDRSADNAYDEPQGAPSPAAGSYDEDIPF